MVVSFPLFGRLCRWLAGANARCLENFLTCDTVTPCACVHGTGFSDTNNTKLKSAVSVASRRAVEGLSEQTFYYIEQLACRCESWERLQFQNRVVMSGSSVSSLSEMPARVFLDGRPAFLDCIDQ